eukprot:15177374-Ditylum_brightwellii.AAC.1
MRHGWGASNATNPQPAPQPSAMAFINLLSQDPPPPIQVELPPDKARDLAPSLSYHLQTQFQARNTCTQSVQVSRRPKNHLGKPEKSKFPFYA